MPESSAQRKRRLKMHQVQGKLAITMSCKELCGINVEQVAELLRTVVWVEEVVVTSDVDVLVFYGPCTLARIKQNVFMCLESYL